MDLQLHKPGDHNYIHSVTDTTIRIVETDYHGSVIVSPGHVVENWPVNAPGELAPEHLEPIFALQPEIVLLGTGSRQVFPDASLMMLFYRRGIGIEAMNTQAAARTFNVLVSESRNVAAALLPLNA